MDSFLSSSLTRGGAPSSRIYECCTFTVILNWHGGACSPRKSMTVGQPLAVSLNRRMNLKSNINFKGAEPGIEGLAIYGLEFGLVVLVHDAGQEHFEIFLFRIGHDN